jgi:hypothetical protein
MSKSILVFTLAVLSSSNAFAKTLPIQCTTPRVLAGGAMVKIQGNLNVGKVVSGQKSLSGVLQLQIRSPRRAVFNGPVNVGGVYDSIRGLEYATLGSNESGLEDTLFYISFRDPKASYVEFHGETYPVDCTKGNAE